MLLAVGVTAVRCRALPSRTPMLRRQGKQKGRRRVLLSDLKALLLRPPPLTPMNGQQAAGSAGASSAEWSRAAGGTEGTGGTGDSTGGDGDSPAQDCPKEKVDKLDKLGERASLSSYTDSGARTPLCRICFQGPEQGELLSPCRCSGSVRCTHEPCLIKWISERGSWSCELCYYKYQVIAISTKNPLQVSLIIRLLSNKCLILFYTSFSPENSLIVHEGPSAFRIFNRWQAVNQQWKVLNYDKLKDTEDPQKGGASSTLRSFTLPLSHRVGASTSPPNGSGPSPSTSSLMGVTTATATPGTAIPLPPVAPETEESSEAENGPASLAEHHCAYNLLQLLSQHLRPQEPRPPPAAVAAPAGQAANGNRELVMRVTTV
uniref:RING-type E3 ubiquitin transferase n=1 Tax=Astyanax mexicanus TaxID=7994 RepID=A0A8B9KFB7_ASTMX